MKKTIVLCALLMGMSLVVSCDKGDMLTDDNRATKKPEQDSGLTGHLKLDGSTTVYPIAKHAAKVFMQKHPQIVIDVQQSSTGEGLTKFLKKTIDVSNATRPPKEKEYVEAENRGMDLQMNVISNDAVVVIVHKENPLKNISTEELKKIFFTGEITDWSQVEGSHKKGKIKVYGTDPEISGTADLFIKKIHKGGKFVQGYMIKHPTPTIVPTIASDPGGIAYTPLKWIDDSVTLLSVDGIAPDTETILNSAYHLSRKMMMITDGAPEGLARDFIMFIMSKQGQEIVKEEGFIPIF